MALLISCCDSRVNGLSIFGAAHGDFFVHRNIANLVPPYHTDNHGQATSAVIEYAVTVLKVPRIIVMGHSKCGGVAGCRGMCEGNAGALELHGLRTDIGSGELLAFDGSTKDFVSI